MVLGHFIEKITFVSLKLPVFENYSLSMKLPVYENSSLSMESPSYEMSYL